MANGTTTARMHQYILLGLIIFIVVLLFAIAFLVSEFVFPPRLSTLSSPPTAARVLEELAPPPATPTTRPTQPSLVIATGAPAAGPTLAPSPLPVVAPAEPTPVIIILPLVHGPAGAPAVATPLSETPVSDPALATTTIELRVSCPAEVCIVQGLQTVVQWQDGSGAWHDVPGWAAGLDAEGRLSYGIDSSDLGSGPYRWAVLGECPCGPLAVSLPFYLPSRAGESLPVEVALGR